MSTSLLTRSQIIELFNDLNKELEKKSVIGDIYLVGGAVMCLVFNAREATRDLDALFVPTKEVNDAVKTIAAKHELPNDWLNDAAKGFFSEQGEFEPYLELSNLNVFKAQTEYLLAMKCLAMRLGEEYHDLNDVRFLLRYLNVNSYIKALEIICTYYPLERFPQKTLYALEEILTDD